MKSDLEEKLKDEKKVCEFAQSAAILTLRNALIFTSAFLILECCQFDWKQNAIHFAIFGVGGGVGGV